MVRGVGELRPGELMKARGATFAIAVALLLLPGGGILLYLLFRLARRRDDVVSHGWRRRHDQDGRQL